MNDNKILLKQVYGAFKEKIAVIGLLLFVSFSLVFSSISLIIESNSSLIKEMSRVGFGDICIWLSNNAQAEKASLNLIPAISEVREQGVIYSDYEINGIYSDNEGQILKPDDTFKYILIDADGKKIANQEISENAIYVSPAMISGFDAKIGDTITFEMARSNGKKSFQIAGFFADPFMGSSMIDMKSFLISERDYEELDSYVKNTKSDDVLAQTGTMLHVFGTKEYHDDASRLQKEMSDVYENSGNIMFSYNANTIKSYMLMLSNILSAFMLIAGILLFIVTLIVTVNVNTNVIQKEYKNLCSLKTIGVKGRKIIFSYVTIWGIVLIISLVMSLPMTELLIVFISKKLVTSTGLLLHVKMNISWIMAYMIITFLIFTVVLMVKCHAILKMKPEVIVANTENINFVKNKIDFRNFIWNLSIRDFLSGKKHYLGTIIISVVLVLFLGIIGRMGNWLGSNGEGLMNTFSVAEHDLGVQPFNETVPMDEIERVISWYSPIKEKYELAMQNVTVDGNEYTANILNDTSYFHLLRGKVCEGKEILITETIASELGIDVNDTVTIASGGRHEKYTVSGIYQCANGMGNNIGMDMAGYSLIGDVTGFIWCHHYILENGNMRDYCMKYLQENYGGIDVHTNSWSGLSGIVSTMHLVMVAIYILAVLFVFFSVWLNAKSIIQNESKNLAIEKSIGISTHKLRMAFAIRFLIASLVGAMIGTLLSLLFANEFILSAFKMMGIGEFTEGISFIGVLLPLMLIPAMFMLSAFMVSGMIKRISLLKIIREM